LSYQDSLKRGSDEYEAPEDVDPLAQLSAAGDARGAHTSSSSSSVAAASSAAAEDESGPGAAISFSFGRRFRVPKEGNVLKFKTSLSAAAAAKAWCRSVRSGNTGRAIEIARRSPFVINQRDPEGRNALSFAIESAKPAMFIELSRMGCELTCDHRGATPLSRLIFRRASGGAVDIVRILLAQIAEDGASHLRYVRPSDGSERRMWVGAWFESDARCTHPCRELFDGWIEGGAWSYAVRAMAITCGGLVVAKEIEAASRRGRTSTYAISCLLATDFGWHVFRWSCMDARADAARAAMRSESFEKTMAHIRTDEPWLLAVESMDMQVVCEMLALFPPPNKRVFMNMCDVAISNGWISFIHCALNKDAMYHFASHTCGNLSRHLSHKSVSALDSITQWCVRPGSSDASYVHQRCLSCRDVRFYDALLFSASMDLSMNPK
jgi:hypothetical protein